MHAGGQHHAPHEQADNQIRSKPADTKPIQREQQRQTGRSESQGYAGHMRRIEQADNDNRAKVIKDSQSRQENLKRCRYAAAQNGDNAERKRYIGRSRNSPSAQRIRIN